LQAETQPDGDVALARAARSAGIPFVLSTASNATIEDVTERAGGDLWFQLYVVQRDLARLLVGRAKEAGYRVLVLTVDVAVNGKRDRDLRNGFAIPFRQTPRSVLDAVAHPRWALGQIRHGLPQLANFASPDATDVNAQAALMRRQMDASFCWQDLQALRDAWPGTLLPLSPPLRAGHFRQGRSASHPARLLPGESRCAVIGTRYLQDTDGRKIRDHGSPKETSGNGDAEGEFGNTFVGRFGDKT